MFASPSGFQSRARATGPCRLGPPRACDSPCGRNGTCARTNLKAENHNRMPSRTINDHDSCLRFILTLKYFKFAPGETTIFNFASQCSQAKWTRDMMTSHDQTYPKTDRGCTRPTGQKSSQGTGLPCPRDIGRKTPQNLTFFGCWGVTGRHRTASNKDATAAPEITPRPAIRWTQPGIAF